MPPKRARSSSRSRFAKRVRYARSFSFGPPRRVRTLRRRIGFGTNSFSCKRWMKNGMPAANISLNAGNTYDSTSSILSWSGTSTGLETEFSMYFTLGSVEFAEFASLFDQYKISKVQFQIKMIDCPESAGRTAGAQFYPTLWWVQDNDDINVATVSTIKEYTKCKHCVLRPNKEVNIMCYPKCNMTIYAGAGTTTTAIPIRNPWIDMTTVSVPFFGLKCAIEYEGLTMPATANLFRYKINCRYFLRFKGVR